MKFSDLDFQPDEDWLTGVQAVYIFENGYGVSVVRNPYSYGGPDGLYEIAVIKGNPDDWQIAYDTPITDDVLGWQTVKDVENVLEKVKNL